MPPVHATDKAVLSLCDLIEKWILTSVAKLKISSFRRSQRVIVRYLDIPDVISPFKWLY